MVLKEVRESDDLSMVEGFINDAILNQNEGGQVVIKTQAEGSMFWRVEVWGRDSRI